MKLVVVAFISSLVLALISASVAAQPPEPARLSRIGVLTTFPRPVVDAPEDSYSAFLQALRDLGYVEGRNVVIEWRHTGGKTERRRSEAIALMAWKPDVVVTIVPSYAEVLRELDARVPIVLIAGGDFVAGRLVTSLSRPGGNITGLQMLIGHVAPKRLQILKEIMPNLECVALLRGSSVSPLVEEGYRRLFADLDSASPTLSLRVRDVPIAPGDDLERVVSQLKKECDAVMVESSPVTTAQIDPLIALALRYRLPTVHDTGYWARSGGLVSYGPNLPALWQRAARFVDRILKGEKPANMPVEQPRNFELIINLRTAKLLKIEIPKHVLLLADRVIE